MHKLLITGASGFIGSAVLRALGKSNYFEVIAAVRSKYSLLSENFEIVEIGDIDQHTDWRAALKGVTTIIHLAARAHILKDQSQNPLADFMRTNSDGALHLAKQGVHAGVKRMVFVSSIGVNGAETFSKAFMPDDEAAPHSPYAVSKYDAEKRLKLFADDCGLEVVIVRPPLVHGPAAPGNFGSLVRLLRRGVPLPLGAVLHNRRSLVGLDNLVDLLLLCATHPAAANQTFLASDGEDVSTADLLRRIGVALGKPAKLLPVPVGLLKLGAAALGKADMAQRLLGSLQVDISKNRQLLGWQPPVSLDEGLKRVVANY